jgi:hypothetical protein
MSYSIFESSRKDGRPVYLYKFAGSDPAFGPLGPYCFTNAEDSITRDSLTYDPWPVQHGEVVQSGTLDKKSLEISLARGTELDGLFSAYPPSQVVNAFIFKGHLGDTPSTLTYLAEWSGQVRGVNYEENELRLTIEPISTSMRRPGLRRNYQLGCPHALYGEECRANKSIRTQTRSVVSVSGKNVTLSSSVTTPRGVGAFKGGLVQWTRPGGEIEVATIASINAGGTVLTLRGIIRELSGGTSLAIAPGCNRTMDHCIAIHGNIANFGGQPGIPLVNPISTTSIFY